MSEGIDLISGPRNTTPTGAPHTADFRITGSCQLRCAWCWGPDHLRRGSITEEQLNSSLEKLAIDGLEHVVFSGGEPTLSPILRPGIDTAKANGLRVTLSTNGINIGKSRDILHEIDDLGIPIDGSSAQVNELMRRRSDKFNAWTQAIGAIVLAQRINNLEDANITITSRTVIARPNLEDIPNIPEALAKNGVDIDSLRIKLYQVEPFGPHYSETDFESDWAVTAEEAQSAAEATRTRYPGLNLTLQLYERTVGRYFLVDPDGLATGTDEDHLGRPIEVPYGNIITDYGNTLATYREHQASIAVREAQ